MKHFSDVQDLREWLEPMGYEEFWNAIAPFKITNIIPREISDHDLRNGNSDLETILYGLKGMAENELTIRLNLDHRIEAPQGITVH